MTQVASKSRQHELCPLTRTMIKANGIVVWTVRSESGYDYRVVVFNGKVSSCERTDGEPCNGWRYRHTCHHTELVASREQERILANMLQQHHSDAAERETERGNYELSISYNTIEGLY